MACVGSWTQHVEISPIDGRQSRNVSWLHRRRDVYAENSCPVPGGTCKKLIAAALKISRKSAQQSEHHPNPHHRRARRSVLGPRAALPLVALRWSGLGGQHRLGRGIPARGRAARTRLCAGLRAQPDGQPQNPGHGLAQAHRCLAGGGGRNRGGSRDLSGVVSSDRLCGALHSSCS